MATIAGMLGLADNDRSYINTIGQRVVYDATMQLLNQYNAELARAAALFIGETVTDHKRRYKLPGNGRMQERGGRAQSGAVKASGSWDVAFPLKDFGDAIFGDDIALAYMTLPEYQRHLDTVTIRARNTLRYEILAAILNSAQDSWVDDNYGTLTVEPLANGDAVVYPPVEGSQTEATDNHYLESGYAASAIDATNNPVATAVDELEEHFGGGTPGGSNIAVFFNQAQTAKIRAVSGFTAIEQNFVRIGQDTAQAINVPANLPGKVIGYLSGAWCVEWRSMPANYVYGQHLEAPAPLIQRVDPAETGLGQGLQLVSEDADYPFKGSHWRYRFGLGVGNRLNGVVIELGTGGTYTVPTGY